MIPSRRYRLVIALDESEYAELVLEHGLDQAARHDAPDIHVIAAIEDDRVVATATCPTLVVATQLDSSTVTRSSRSARAVTK